VDAIIDLEVEGAEMIAAAAKNEKTNFINVR